MTENYDLIVRNALLRGATSTMDIAIAGGKIAKIAPKLAGQYRQGSGCPRQPGYGIFCEHPSAPVQSLHPDDDG